MTNHLAWLVVASLAAMAPLTQAALKNYNLILPSIRSAQVKGCNAQHVCNFTLSTRAATYQLINFDTETGLNGSLVRDDADWTGPKKMDGQIEESNEGFEARVEFEVAKNKYFIGIRDSMLHICGTSESDCLTKPEEFADATASQFSLPISALAVWIYPDNAMDLFLFDVSGRLMRNSVGIKDWTLDEKARWTLSAIANPLHGTLGENKTVPKWLQNSIYFKNTSVENRLNDNLIRKVKAAYVQSITPVGKQPDSLNNLTLCWSNGHKQGTRFLPCYHKGLDKENVFPELGTANDSNTIVSHAIHRHDDDAGNRYLHFAYTVHSKTSKAKPRYLYCAFKANTPQRVELTTVTTGDNSASCMPILMRRLPNDIIGYKTAKCSKMIAFYNQKYSVHDAVGPIHTVTDEQAFNQTQARWKSLSNQVNFYINAAFSVQEKIYFFTGVNRLIAYDTSMDAGCTTLELGKKEEMRSQEFLSQSLYNPFTEPFLIDFREFAQGANETRPPTNDSTANLEPDPHAVSKDKPKGSSVVIIAIGLILGGLIIAAIVYLFCLRASGEDRPALKRKSRRPKTPVGLDNGGNMSSMKTVRSEPGHSKISKAGSKISSGHKSKSHGSKKSKIEMSPLQKQSAPQQQQQPTKQAAGAAPGPTSTMTAATSATAAASPVSKMAGAKAASEAPSGAQKSPAPMQSPKSKRSTKSGRSPKSQRSPKSPKTPRSKRSSSPANKSIKSPIIKSSAKSPSSTTGAKTGKSSYNVGSPKDAKTEVTNK